MKKIILILLIVPLLLFCGFKRAQKAYILTADTDIANLNNSPVSTGFYSVRQRINYVLVSPEGFKYPGIRMQISKQDEKTSNWGFSIIQSRDFTVDMAKNSYKDYVYIQKPGHYILQFFYLNKKSYPFAHTEFWVQ
ncbi:hypothetical protein IJ182_11475 [bacterium]|nr:hypothetical protein [bacterium]